MGEYDFTYEVPENFHNRVIQYLIQFGQRRHAEAFQQCQYEYTDVGLAYYAGLKGDNWNKKAIDFTFEGASKEISVLQSTGSRLKDAIGMALKPSESGYLVRNLFFLDSDLDYSVIENHLSDEDRLNSDIQTAKTVLRDLLQVGERICLNNSFNATSSENRINDSFRDMLSIKGYHEVKDQTRHGVSVKGNDAGEVDILLTKAGKEIAIFEGLKLDSVKREYIDEHIDKAINNYNALGTATFIVAYVNSADFESFWERYFSFLQQYEFPLQVRRPLNQLPHPNAAARVATLILSRDGYDFPVYFIALKIC